MSERDRDLVSRMHQVCGLMPLLLLAALLTVLLQVYSTLTSMLETRGYVVPVM
jgi:hypothetical protein